MNGTRGHSESDCLRGPDNLIEAPRVSVVGRVAMRREDAAEANRHGADQDFTPRSSRCNAAFEHSRKRSRTSRRTDRHRDRSRSDTGRKAHFAQSRNPAHVPGTSPATGGCQRLAQCSTRITPLSATVRKCGATDKFYSNGFKQSGAVPLKQQTTIEMHLYRFALLVQNGDRGR
jgi:hypothetical protein